MTATHALDTRCLPARNGIAARALRGQVDAARFVDPQRFRVAVATLPLLKVPVAGGPYVTEGLYGDMLDVLDVSAGWALVQARSDGYVGYVQAEGLAPAGSPATHRVADLRAFLYPAASIKATPLGLLPYGATVAVSGMEGAYARTEAGFVYARHLCPVDSLAADPVAEAERFLGIPYLWGGRSSLGIDCSGLVQVVHAACGIALPRDSDMQEEAFGTEIPIPADPMAFLRGDLLFWPGHVAIAQGGGFMVHANAYFMQVTREPIAEALARIGASGTALRRVRRLLTNA